MDKNTVIGLVLIMAVIFGFSWLNQPSKEELARRQHVRDSIAASNEAAYLAQLELERQQAIADSLAAIGEATLDEVIIKDNNLGFHFLPAGVIPPNPAELVRSEEMVNLLNDLSQRYDYRILDTSPLGLVSDAYALTSMVDVNLLITRVFKSDKSFFRNFIEQVQQVR